MNQQPWSHLISIDGVSQIHQECIEKFGGDRTPEPKPGCVEGSVGAAWNGELYAGGEDATEGLCFAGCLLFYLVKNHCFMDGNKRVAWVSCMEVLRALSLTVGTSDDEAEQFCLDIINGTGEVKSAVDVCRWLAPRLAGC